MKEISVSHQRIRLLRYRQQQTLWTVSTVNIIFNLVPLRRESYSVGLFSKETLLTASYFTSMILQFIIVCLQWSEFRRVNLNSDWSEGVEWLSTRAVFPFFNCILVKFFYFTLYCALVIRGTDLSPCSGSNVCIWLADLHWLNLFT